MNEPTATLDTDQIVADYFAALDAGSVPNRADLLARFPGLAAELHDFFDALDQVERTTEPLRETLSGPTAGTRTHHGHTPLPESIGPFDILGVLGQGGMGVVYKARDRRIGRLAALKVILAGGWHSPAHLERFRREAHALAKLQHPHVVQLLEFDEWQPAPGVPPVPYLAMEFVSGGSLDRATSGQAQPPADAARLVELLARAVDAAHRTGVVHRDLKPANVLLAPCQPGDPGATPYGLPKVTDFGLAHTASSGGPPLTDAGAIMGTASYMAPEQANGQPAGPAADVWALGVMLYELLAGHQPFAGRTLTQVLVAVQSAEPPPLTGVPAALAAVCMRCLRKSAADRFANAGELAEALNTWRASGRKPDVQAAATGTSGLGPNARRPVSVIAAVALLLAVLAGWAVLRKPIDGSDSARVGAGPPRPERLEGGDTPPLPNVGDKMKAALLNKGKARFGPAETVPFKAKVEYVMTRKGDARRQLIPVTDPAARPLQKGDEIAIEATVEPPAYVYLLWIDSEGTVQPVYPWKAGDWRQFPADEKPVGRVRRPGDAGNFFPVEPGPSGMETLVLLTRSMPLPPAERTALTERLPKFDRQAWPDDLAPVWSDDWEVPTNDPKRALGLSKEQLSSNPAVRRHAELRAKLGPLFEHSCTVSFENQGGPR